MKVVSVKQAGRADVYNMEVEQTHDFLVQNGMVAHNCYDSARYFCMARPVPMRHITPPPIKEPLPFRE